MTHTKDEALRLALEALEDVTKDYAEGRQYKHNKAITAIKEALAQPEQEPVREEKYIYGTPLLDAMTQDYRPPQRTWVGLTKDEQNFVYRDLHNATSRKDSFWVDFANAIEAKLKEKQ